MRILPSPPPTRARSSSGWGLPLLLLALAVWVAWDLAGPRHFDIRDFDPVRVARLDTDMWRSYYERQPLRLYFQLAQLLREQFHFPLLRSYGVAFRAAHAAFVFKDGHGRTDYQRALPDLVAYYAAIRTIGTRPFEVRKTAELELEWWIVHRERVTRGGPALEHALAGAAAALYQVPPASLDRYAHERAVAMTIRDLRAAHGGVREQDWRTIDRRLRSSWASLWGAVHPGSAARPT